MHSSEWCPILPTFIYQMSEFVAMLRQQIHYQRVLFLSLVCRVSLPLFFPLPTFNVDVVGSKTASTSAAH